MEVLNFPLYPRNYLDTPKSASPLDEDETWRTQARSQDEVEQTVTHCATVHTDSIVEKGKKMDSVPKGNGKEMRN
jgi:hypothetical protein